MAIDESAGALDRKDKVVRTSAQSYALAQLSIKGSLCHPNAVLIGAHTIKGLERRGWLVVRPRPEVSPWAKRYCLTDEGRRVADASPAVQEWLRTWGVTSSVEQTA